MNITEAKEYIKANKDFLDGIAKYKNAPQKDNQIAKQLINCWRIVLKYIGSKVVVPDCASCGGVHPLIDLWMYCEKVNWFYEAPVITETIVKPKRKRIDG